MTQLVTWYAKATNFLVLIIFKRKQQFIFLAKFLTFAMHSSPLHRFQRTRPAHMSPNPFRNPQSPKHVDKKTQQSIKVNRQIHAVKSCEGSPQISQLNQEVEDKITNLQKMLQVEKAKRQTQFGELFKMINSLKSGQRPAKEKDEPKFIYDELQFPMTPRVRARQNDGDSQKSYNQQTYTPVYQTVSKAKPKFIQKDQQRSVSKSFEQFSIKSLEIMLLKIQRETQYNNINFLKINKQISSIRTALTRVKQPQQRYSNSKSQQISAELQKYVKDVCYNMKSQIQMERSSIQNFVAKKIDEKWQQNMKSLKQIKTNRQQINQINKKIKSTSLQLQQQIKASEMRNSNQIFVLNNMIQQKFAAMKQSILEQTIKENKQNTAKIIQDIEKQKKRIDQIQQYNSQFFSQLQKTMGNIQQKLKNTRNAMFQYQSQHKIQQLKNFIQDEKQRYFKQISARFDSKLSSNMQQIKSEINGVLNRLQKMEEPQILKLTAESSINTQQSALNQIQQKAALTTQNKGISKNSIQNVEKLYNQQIQNKFEKMLELISQNCSYLQTRNCAIEQSMAEVIWVLNDLVEKLKHIM